MAQTCLLHGMLVMLVLSSLVSQGIGNIWVRAESVELRNTSTDNFVSSDTPPVLCGRRPAMRKTFNDSDADDGLDKIIAGRLATHGHYPWTVNIRGKIVKDGVVTHGHVCGGAIISEYWVLTAANCMRYGNESTLSIIVGDFDRRIKDEGEQKFLLDKFIPHNQFTGFSNSVRHLKSVRLRCRTKQFCRRYIYSRAQITDRMFCGGTKFGEDDVCDGDLGGPGAFGWGHLFILIGIMSHGTICQKRNYPVIFASVSAHLPWIEKTIAANSNFGEGTIPKRRVKLTEGALSATNETLLA